MNKQYLPYLFAFLALSLVLFLWWQGSQKPKEGSIPSESSQIEVVPITPSQKFTNPEDTSISRVQLLPPAQVSGDQVTGFPKITGELRSLIENGMVIFTVVITRGEEQTVTVTVTETPKSDDLFVWIKGKTGEWQRVCQVLEDKGGWQCGGSLPVTSLPVSVSLVRGLEASPTGGGVVLEGTIQAP